MVRVKSKSYSIKKKLLKKKKQSKRRKTATDKCKVTDKSVT